LIPGWRDAEAHPKVVVVIRDTFIGRENR